MQRQLRKKMQKWFFWWYFLQNKKQSFSHVKEKKIFLIGISQRVFFKKIELSVTLKILKK